MAEALLPKNGTILDTFQCKVTDTISQNVDDVPSLFSLAQDVVQTYSIAIGLDQSTAHQYLISRDSFLLYKFKTLTLIVFEPSRVGANAELTKGPNKDMLLLAV